MKCGFVVVACVMVVATSSPASESTPSAPPDNAQVPTWSQDDMDFFLHGSMGTEVVPENVLRALIKTYPDLFPAPDLLG